MSNVLVFVLELIGTAAFTVSGAIVGIKKQMDLFGVIVLGVCTAVGGGIVRDKVARGLGVYRRGRKAQDFEQVGKVGVRNALCGVVVLGGVTGACNIQ